MIALADDFGLGAAAPDALKKGTDIPTFVGMIIQGFLALVGIIFLILTVYGGAMYMISRGEAAKAKSAREIVFNALIGLLIVMGSYALTSYIISAVSGTPE